MMPRIADTKYLTLSIDRPRTQAPAGYVGHGRSVSRTIVSGLTSALDGGLIVVSGVSALLYTSEVATIDWSLASLQIALVVVLFMNCLRFVRAYRFDALRRHQAAIGTAVLAWLTVMGILFAIDLFKRSPTTISHDWRILWLLLGLTLICAGRCGLILQFWHLRRTGRLRRRIAIVGAGGIGVALIRQITSADDDLEIVGLYDDRAKRLPPRCLGYPILGTVDDLVESVRQNPLDCVIVSLPLSAEWRLAEILNKLQTVPVGVRVALDQFGTQLGKTQVSVIGGVTLLNAIDTPLQGWKHVAKAIEDRCLAALVLALVAPAMLVIAVLIKVDSAGPVLFRQKRYGFNNGLFEVLKFRTMYHSARDPNAEQLTQRNDPRITKIGKFLRRTSLDELPQFINVLLGDMSIVGPRPHALAAKAAGLLYRDAVPYYDARHCMKPGITGWAQVKGWRGETETVAQIRTRVEHDLYYLENWSVLFDLKIIARTVIGGFSGRQVY